MTFINNAINGVKTAIIILYKFVNSPFSAIGLPEWSAAAAGITLILGGIGFSIFKKNRP